MRKPIHTILFIAYIVTAFFSLPSCKKNPQDSPWLNVNPKIHLIHQLTDGMILFPVFSGDDSSIYHIYYKSENFVNNGIWKLTPKEDFRDNQLEFLFSGTYTFLNISSNGQWMIAIESNSLLTPGKMWLINTKTLSRTAISDTLMVNVFSAAFLPDNQHLIFYGLGKDVMTKPQGFYLFDMSSDKDSNIASITSQAYGFDISPDGKKIIYGFNSGFRFFDLENHSIDSSYTIYAEWLRYSPDGTQIVFSDNAINFRLPSSTVGLINGSTDHTSTLDVNANGDPYNANFTPFLSWSHDGKMILFSQTSLSHDGGFPGPLNLYLLDMH